MKYLINKLSAFLVMLMCMSATVQAEVVHHTVCDPTFSTRGFNTECWENTETNKFYLDANCTRELTGDLLAQAVSYAKMPTSPITSIVGVSRFAGLRENHTLCGYNFNWAAVDDFQGDDLFSSTVEFEVKEDNAANARLVWGIYQHPNATRGNLIVSIYVNDEIVYHDIRDWGNTLNVENLPNVTKGDNVRFVVEPELSTMDFQFSSRIAVSLEYTFDCHHEFPAGSNTCSKCGYTLPENIVHHTVCEPTLSAPGYTRECWENLDNGKFYSDAACTQELTGAELAKTVVYSKLPASPISGTSEFVQSEHENDWSVDLNWAAVTTFNNAYSGWSSTPRYAEFTAKGDNITNARLVWNRNEMAIVNGKYTVSIYVNGNQIFSRNQNGGEEFEGVFVQSLLGLKKGDIVKFEVTQNAAASTSVAKPIFKACLEYTSVCDHEYPAGSAICSKCGYVKEHEHNYVNHECTLCGAVEKGDIIGYVGTNADRKDIKWVLDENTHILTFTGTGAMEAFNLEHNAWRNENKTTVTKVVIGEGITSIGDGSYPNGYFIEMSGLTEVVLPSTLKTIGSSGFQDCVNLTSITLPEGLETIKENGIRNCKKITSITLPSTLTSIGSTAFADCSGLLDMYIAGSEPITTANDAFSYINRGNITLHVNGDLYDWAKATSPWSGFNILRPYNIEYTDAEGESHKVKVDTEASDNTLTLTDGVKNLTIYEDIPMQTLTYTRNFSAANTWQALFVPFDIELTAKVLEKCDIAKPYMVATDGSIGGNVNEGEGADIVVLKKLKAGDVANHGTAYYIRPKEAGAFQLKLSDVTLYATDATTTLSCATTEDTYEFVGQYVAGKPASGTWYALSGGGFRLGDNESPDLPAMRWYMTKTSKNGSPAPAPARLRIMTWGEDDVTAIMETQAARPSDNAIYSLSGVRMNKLHKGINVVNGKKIVR